MGFAASSHADAINSVKVIDDDAITTVPAGGRRKPVRLCRENEGASLLFQRTIL